MSNDDDNGESGGIEEDILLSLSLKANGVEITGLAECDCVVTVSLISICPALILCRTWMAACNMMQNLKILLQFQYMYKR